MLSTGIANDFEIRSNASRRQAFRDVLLDLMLNSETRSSWSVARTSAALLLEKTELVSDLNELEQKRLISQANLTMGCSLLNLPTDAQQNASLALECFLKAFDAGLEQKEQWMITESVCKIMTIKSQDGPNEFQTIHHNALRHLYDALGGAGMGDMEMFAHVAVAYAKSLSDGGDSGSGNGGEEKEKSASARKGRDAVKRGGGKPGDPTTIDLKLVEEVVRSGFACKGASAGINASLVQLYTQTQLARGQPIAIIESEAILKILTTVECLDCTKKPPKDASAPSLEQLVTEIKQADIPEDLQVALWVRVARIMLINQHPKSAWDVLKNIVSTAPTDSANMRYFALAESYKGQALMSLIGADSSTVRNEMRVQACYHFSVCVKLSDRNSPQYWNAVRLFWNAANPLSGSADLRLLIKLAIETIIHMPPDTQTVASASVEDQIMFQTLYLLLLQIYQDQGNFKGGLHLVEKACQVLPSQLHRPLWKIKILFGCMLGRSISKDLFDPATQAYVWLTLGYKRQRGKEKQKQDFIMAIECLPDSEAELKTEFLLDYINWLLSSEGMSAEVAACLKKSSELLGSLESAGIRSLDLQIRVSYMMWTTTSEPRERMGWLMNADKAIDSVIDLIFGRYREQTSENVEPQAVQHRTAVPSASHKKIVKDPVPISKEPEQTNERPSTDADWISYKWPVGMQAIVTNLCVDLSRTRVDGLVVCLILVVRALTKRGYHLCCAKTMALAELMASVDIARLVICVQKSMLQDFGFNGSLCLSATDAGLAEKNLNRNPSERNDESDERTLDKILRLIVAQQLLESRMYQTTADLFQTHLELDSVWGPDLCPDALRILAEIAAATDDIEAARTMLVHALGTCKGDAQSWARLTYAISGNLLRSHREKESLELLTLMIDKYSNILNQIGSPIPKPPLIPVLARLLQKKADILFQSANTRKEVNVSFDLMRRAEAISESDEDWCSLLGMLAVRSRMVLDMPKLLPETYHESRVEAREILAHAEQVYSKLPNRTFNKTNVEFSVPHDRLYLQLLLWKCRIETELAQSLIMSIKHHPREQTIEQKISSFVQGTDTSSPILKRWMELQSGSLQRAYEGATMIAQKSKTLDVTAGAYLAIGKCHRLAVEYDLEEIPASKEKEKEYLLNGIALALQEGACWQELFAATEDMFLDFASDDPILAFQHLSLLQGLTVEQKALDLLTKAANTSNIRTESFWLSQYAFIKRQRADGNYTSNLAEQYLQAVTYLEKAFLPWKRMHIGTGHDTVVKALPKSFKILILQHSADGKKLYAGVVSRRKETAAGPPASKAKKSDAVNTADVEPGLDAKVIITDADRDEMRAMEDIRNGKEANLRQLEVRLEEYLQSTLRVLLQDRLEPEPERKAKPRERPAGRNSVSNEDTEFLKEEEYNLVICADEILQQFPLESLFRNKGNGVGTGGFGNILSVSRDFSVHMFMSRLRFPSSSQNGRGGSEWQSGKTKKDASMSSTVSSTAGYDAEGLTEISSLNYVIGASNASGVKEDVKKLLKGEGVTEDSMRKASPTDYIEYMRNGSFLYIGDGPFTNSVGPEYISQTDLSACKLFASLSEPVLSIDLILLLSLQGVDTVVTCGGRNKTLKSLLDSTQPLGEYIRNSGHTPPERVDEERTEEGGKKETEKGSAESPLCIFGVPRLAFRGFKRG